jgi:hypothetical protein
MTGIKRICLIRDDRPLWVKVAEYLQEVNAETITLEGDPLPGEIQSTRPNLIILNARVHHGMGHRFSHTPMMVIKEGTPPVALIRETAERNLFITGWPLGNKQFLEITSRLLTIAPRRIFKTLIRIFVTGDDHGFLGQSRDFSLSGMAFMAERDLKNGEKIHVSFSIPEKNKSLRLGAEVTRRSSTQEEDGRYLYGARFEGLGDEDRNTLTSFIL